MAPKSNNTVSRKEPGHLKATATSKLNAEVKRAITRWRSERIGAVNAKRREDKEAANNSNNNNNTTTTTNNNNKNNNGSASDGESNDEAVSIKPPVCDISPAGGVSRHEIVNNTDKMLAFKIKSSDNSNYSVNTSHGLIPAGNFTLLFVTRARGGFKSDKLVIMYCDVKETCVNPLDPFKDDNVVGEFAGEMAIKLTAAEG